LSGASPDIPLRTRNCSIQKLVIFSYAASGRMNIKFIMLWAAVLRSLSCVPAKCCRFDAFGGAVRGVAGTACGGEGSQQPLGGVLIDPQVFRDLPRDAFILGLSHRRPPP